MNKEYKGPIYPPGCKEPTRWEKIKFRLKYYRDMWRCPYLVTCSKLGECRSVGLGPNVPGKIVIARIDEPRYLGRDSQLHSNYKKGLPVGIVMGILIVTIANRKLRAKKIKDEEFFLTPLPEIQFFEYVCGNELSKDDFR